MSAYTGELAALATSLFFTATSTIFTLAGRQVGSMVVNRTRLLAAIVFLVAAHWFLAVPLPFGAGADRWLWLGLSGLVGLALGDAFLFQAFIWIGPRLTMLLMSLAPVLAALLAWLFLGEGLAAGQVLGIVLAVSGTAWVILDRSGQGRQLVQDLGGRRYLLGLLFGLGAATGQAVGLVLAKQGVYGDFPALSGTLMRMLAAAAALWVYTLLTRQAAQTVKTLAARPRAMLLILLGAFSGPFLGVTFSLIAVQRTQVGVASTLMALPPVFLLPVGHFLFKERFGWQAVTGTLLAVAGVAVLFLV